MVIMCAGGGELISNLNQKIVEQVWDYTKHAKYYGYRPNYAPRAIDLLCRDAVGSLQGGVVADIGAGSGNLSIMLLERGFDVIAIEPNDAMREIGVERTMGKNIEWRRALGVETGLEAQSVDWVCFGSSFNVMDRELALKESHRILKQNGSFSCMWNHRNLKDPIQSRAEEIIMSFIPRYERGIRREDQREILEKNRELFDEILYLELDFYFHQTIENYINAWKSVKNPYWDLETKEGEELFDVIVYKMRDELPSEFAIQYTTRAWSAKKVK